MTTPRSAASFLRFALPAAALLAPAASARQSCPAHFAPVTGELRINQAQSWDQLWSQVAIRPGGYVCAFTAGQDIYARYYDAELLPVTNEFRVNGTLNVGQQDEPAVAVGTTGNVLFAWSERNGYDGEQMGIYGRVYGPGMTPLAPEFQINQVWMASQWRPLIAPTPTGGFVVAWTGDWDGDSVFRVLDETGAPLTGDIFVNTYVFDAQVDTAPAVSATGDIFMAFVDFSSHGTVGTGLNLYARTYTAGGSARQAAEFPVTTFTSDGHQRIPRAAADALGRFVVTWEDQLGDGSGYSIWARRFDAFGTALEPEFQVNATTAGNQYAPVVAADAQGGFVIAFEDHSLGTPRILARRFDDQAQPLGDEFVVADDAMGRIRPFVAVDAEGEDVLFAYDGMAGAPPSLDAFARRYALSDGPLVFCTPKNGSFGCVPRIGSTGSASLSDPTPFLITATDVRNQKPGLLFYGFGADSTTPFQGGWMCIDTFLARTPAQMSGGGGGQTCLGSFSFDFNAWIQGGSAPQIVPGSIVTAQYFFRDPLDPAGFGTGLTDALRFQVCP